MQTLNKLPGMDLVSETLQGSFYTDALGNPNPGFYVMEEWKWIKGYEGCYQVSNHGRVKSLGRRVYSCNSTYEGTRSVREKILKPCFVLGYRVVTLCKHSDQEQHKIARLVASAFVDNLKQVISVNHIDGNKLNDRADNLEWCTPAENTIHAIDTGLINNSGSKNGRAKLHETDIWQIRYISKRRLMKPNELADLFGISKWYIFKINSGKAWKHVKMDSPIGSLLDSIG